MRRILVWMMVTLGLMCLVFTALAENKGGLFDTGKVHRIDVRISEEDWNDMLNNAGEKTKYRAGIEIDGEEMEDVSFSTKGILA